MEGKWDKVRRFPRIPSQNPVLVRKLGADAITRLSCTKVMGLGGCMFQNDKTFGPDAMLSLLILVRGRYVEARGRVVYELPREAGRYDIGIEFLEIAAPDLEVIGELFEEPPEGSDGAPGDPSPT